MSNKVIEIEGMVASGKTSICKELTNLINNSVFVDGSAIYRGITFAISEAKKKLKSSNENIDARNIVALQNIMNSPEKLGNINAFEVMKMLNIDFKIIDKMTVIYINGNEISNDKIQSMENSLEVSEIASKANNKALYEFARNIIEKYRENFNVIVSGRDLVEIYPDMTCHVFIKADIEERVNRRYAQYEGKYSKEEITNIIIKRDEIHKNAGFDRVGNNNINFDVTNYTNAKQSTVQLVKKLIEKEYLKKEDVIWKNM